MASLRDAQALTSRLQERASTLHAELTGNDVDFSRLAELADEIGASADRLAETFSTMDDALARRVSGAEGADGGEAPEGGLTEALSPRRAARRRSGRSSNSEPSKDELLSRAKELNIAGRSEMSKAELRKAVAQAEAVTKAELLEQAKVADISGRSEMSKAELQKALDAEDS
jgi:hypothetical protein